MKQDWNSALAGVIAAIGDDAFCARMAGVLKLIAGFDYCVIFAYRGDRRPIDLFDNFPSGKRRVFVSMYQEGPYVLDPFFLACARGVDPDLYRLRDLAPDRFYQSEYFRSYYVRTGLSEEIGYFLSLPGAVTVVLSLMRADASPQFSAREFAALRHAHGLVSACAQHHWRDLYRRFSPGEGGQDGDIRRNIDQVFRAVGREAGRTGLTPRELEIVEYVLKGNSSEAIGKQLGISTGTVRIHRKNIYAKLGINSQGELFSRFIDALTA